MSTYAACPEFNPPSRFRAQEQLITIGTDMNLTDGNGRIGEIEERTIRLTPTFDLYNVDGKKVATAYKKLFRWGNTIEVRDCENKIIGTVRENIISSLLGYFTSYDVLDAGGNIIGGTEKSEFFATNFTVSANNREKLMTMRRPAITLGIDVWSIEIFNRNIVDPRIITMIPAFKTSADNKRREEQAKK